jgi:hypothetical protein
LVRIPSPLDERSVWQQAMFRPKWVSVERFAVQRRARRTSGPLMLHQCPCGGIVRCNGWFDGKGPDHCDSSARAIPRSPNFATDLATTDSLTFPHRQPRARIAANGAPRADRSPAAVANIFPPANIRGTFPKPRLSVERYAVKRRRASASTACSTVASKLKHLACSILRRPDTQDQRKVHQGIAHHGIPKSKWPASVERLAVQRRRCRRDGFSILHDFPAAPPSAATACSAASPAHATH